MNTYLTYYNKQYKSKFEYLDLVLKQVIKPEKTIIAEIMSLTLTELEEYLNLLNLSTVNSTNIIKLLFIGSNSFCNLLKRQMHIGIQETYTPHDIAYIYQIPKSTIKAAMHQGDIHTLHPNNIAALFAYIEYMP